MDQTAAKQQIVEKLKQANNVLVTVSNSPSVDQLAACIGMTLFLNKLNKHATAVFSGQIPSTIEFLQPEKTIESNTDSLRDFIISLDKAKADKIRYKIEDQFVRIYITPYRTSIGEHDLVFSEGDFNVEAVLALGVRDRAQLDAAITAHGRILHDATVISVNAGQEAAPSLGQINWQDPSASSLCEMLVSISEAFGTGLVDAQMATAFLTGIVAETERFSNNKTSPKVMTMSAQLMAAGANQQLIVSKLEPPEAPNPVATSGPAAPPSTPSDTLSIPHEEPGKTAPKTDGDLPEIRIDNQGNIVSKNNLLTTLPQLPVAPPAPVPSKPQPLPPVPKLMPEAPTPSPAPVQKSAIPNPALPPLLPTLPAPLPSKPSQTPPKPSQIRHELLNPIDHQPAFMAAFTADTQPDWTDVERKAPMDVLSETSATTANNTALLQKAAIAQSSVMPKLELLESDPAVKAMKRANPNPLNIPLPVASSSPVPTMGTARSAINRAIATAPYDPAFEGPIAALNAQPLSSTSLHPGALTPVAPAPAQATAIATTPASTNDLLKKSPPPPVPPPLAISQAPSTSPVNSVQGNPDLSKSLLKPIGR
ncbi:MAG TPA: hypothetical protein VFB03_01615 [Candidatus Saccharimonadales bacterium]|nr:hypothetical protein [Candidatus Saccharimonadales bacterium]